MRESDSQQKLNKTTNCPFLIHLLTCYQTRQQKPEFSGKQLTLDFSSNHHIKQKIGISSTFEHRINTLITTEEDKRKERSHVKKALKRCGHPNWSLNRKRKKKEEKVEKVERRGKVVLPYVKGISEKMARIFKKYDIETIHKPTTKLKSLLCNKMKDKVEMLDRTGAIYYDWCKKGEGCNERKKNDYVGETDRVIRGRQYEHRTVDHKTATRSASINHEEDNKPEPAPVAAPTRRSSRSTRKKIDYKKMDKGEDLPLTEGSTEFSKHVASNHHEKSDLQFTILCTDDNWFNRGVKEAIAIRKIQPTLNQDEGRHHLPKMYDKLIRSCVTLRTPRQGTEGITSAQTEESSSHAAESTL